MTRPGYFLHAAGANLARNWAPSLVAAATICVALLILGVFMLLNHNLQRLAASARGELRVTAYLQENLSAAEAEKARREAAKFPAAAEVNYISPDEALGDLRRRLGEGEDILAGLEGNPLPGSLEIRLKPEAADRAGLPGLLRMLAAVPGVDDVRYSWEWAEKLQKVIDFTTLAGYALGGLLFLAIVFIIANTIKLTVMARRDELYIMRLMGATRWFIRTPFIIEGVVQGAVGGAAALVLLGLFHAAVVARLRLPFGLSSVRLEFLPAGSVWFLLVSGAVLGLVGSLISLGRFGEDV